jgi:DNA polymerase III epsilon subunit-like protein
VNFETWPQRLLVVDVEGNGASPPDLVELAALPIRNGAPDTSTAGAWLVHPPVPVTPFAARVHGLTNERLADCPPWEAVAGDIEAMLEGAWLAAHNASVEYRILSRHLPAWEPAGVVDTLRLARAVYKKAPKHNLDALIQHVQPDLTAAPAHRHRAAFDAYATGLLLLDMASHYATWNALTTTAVPPSLPGAPDPQQEPTLW